MGGFATKVIGMAKEKGMIKEVKEEEPKQEETKKIEESDTKKLLRIKRKGRSSTVLSSSSGVEGEASVSKKTLLGG